MQMTALDGWIDFVDALAVSTSFFGTTESYSVKFHILYRRLFKQFYIITLHHNTKINVTTYFNFLRLIRFSNMYVDLIDLVCRTYYSHTFCRYLELV